MLSAHAHNLAQYVGKGRQQPTGGMQLESSRSTLQRAGYVLYRALVGKHVSGHLPTCYLGGRLFWPLLSMTLSIQLNYQDCNDSHLSMVCPENVQIE